MSWLAKTSHHALPPAKQAQLRRAQRLEWRTFALRLSIVAALYFALGGVQSLTAVWLKTLYSLWPPVAFLVATQIESVPPNQRFPYGFYRAGSIAFLSAALTLTTMAAYLIYAGLRGLALSKQPALDSLMATSSPVDWRGWSMIAALGYSIAVPIFNGRTRKQLAIDLHDKGLYSDAVMGQASWMVGAASMLGVLAIGAGFWHIDYIATLFIGGVVLRYGLLHLRSAASDLTDEIPRCIGTRDIDPLPDRIRALLEDKPWVESARVRLREEGRFLTGVAFICPIEKRLSLDELEKARAEIDRMDWRLLQLEPVPVTAATLARKCSER